MIASDIPQGFASPTEMARSMATYIACPYEIQRRVREHFDSWPDITTIKRYRATFLRRDEMTYDKAHDGYYPDEGIRDLKAANTRFISALWREHPATMRRLFSYRDIPGPPQGGVIG